MNWENAALAVIGVWIGYSVTSLAMYVWLYRLYPRIQQYLWRRRHPRRRQAL